MATYKWVEWKNRKHNKVTAHAVEPTSGGKRAVNGSLIPKHAVAAKKGTPRDKFCVKILAARAATPTPKRSKTRAKARKGGRRRKAA